MAHTNFWFCAVVADEIEKTDDEIDETIKYAKIIFGIYYASPPRVSRRFLKSTLPLFCVSLKRWQHLPIISAHNYENYWR